jgi:Family of unknown function (DUF6502)
MPQLSTNSGGPDTQDQPKLVAAVRRILRPLVRLLLSQGLTYPWFSDLLKEIYVEVANRDFTLGGKGQTDSRVSLLTGVHRKDVRRLRELSIAPREAIAPPAVSLGAHLVARWASDARYLDGQERPKPLPRLARQGEVSFESLVGQVSKDIRARPVLDEWLRLGVVHVDENDLVHLNVEAFVPRKGFEEKVFYLGANVHDHLSAAADNVAGMEPPWLERSVHYNALSAASVAELHALAEKAGMAALKSVNRKAMELEIRDGDAAVSKQRINFGVYFYSAPSKEDA